MLQYAADFDLFIDVPRKIPFGLNRVSIGVSLY